MTFSDTLKLWRESLTYLRWSTSKLLLLASLNRTLHAHCILFKRFWWILAAVFVCGAVQSFNLAYAESLTYTSILLINFYFFLFILATRPSVENKNLQYFFKYLPGTIFLFIATVPFVFMQINLFVKLICSIFFIPLSYSVFFFFDSKISIQSLLKSIKQGLLFVALFFPGVILFALLLTVLFTLISGLFSILISSLIWRISPLYWLHSLFFINTLLSFGTTSFLIAFNSVLYTKIKHTHFSLFFS